jgi:type IV pilus assembly protein PilN
MIRINLLPFRAARKKENIRRQVSIFGLTVLFMFTLMGYFFWDLSSTLSSLKAAQLQKEKELAAFAETNKKLADLKKKTAEMRGKLEVIRELERKKSGPVNLLEEIALSVPKDKLWLRSLNEKSGALVLEGTAMDNETVALFMTNLEKSPHISSVDLKSTKLKTLPAYKLDVSDFVINCRTYAFKETKPKDVKAAKKR